MSASSATITFHFVATLQQICCNIATNIRIFSAGYSQNAFKWAFMVLAQDMLPYKIIIIGIVQIIMTISARSVDYDLLWSESKYL